MKEHPNDASVAYDSFQEMEVHQRDAAGNKIIPPIKLWEAIA